MVQFLGVLMVACWLTVQAQTGNQQKAVASPSPSDVVGPAAPSQPEAPQAAQPAEGCCRWVWVPCGRGWRRHVRWCCCCPCCLDCCGVGGGAGQTGKSAAATPPKPDPHAWRDLFDGKTLDGWKTPEFGGEGEVSVKDGTIVMEMGSTMTGITYTGEVPRDNYELAWEGSRLDGSDFFATATFPVGKDECSLVTGGWGGMVVGISCIDYFDASDNPTTSFRDFKRKQWYKFRVRVTPAKIEAWIDGDQIVNQNREGHKISIRSEVDLCQPLGISAWVTTGAVRNIRLRNLPPDEAAPAPDPEKPQ